MRIHTVTGSVHEIDPVAMTYTRLVVGADSQELRRDGETMQVLGIAEVKVGEPAVLLLQLRDDGVQTIRRTAVVTEIEGAL